MSKLLITTQVYENYAWNEDGSIGTGANAYWKPKGGSDYLVKNLTSLVLTTIRDLVDAVRPQIEQDNDYFREHVIHWEVVADDYLTEFERDQLEFEGKIVYPVKELCV
jgi:hypothetical protein